MPKQEAQPNQPFQSKDVIQPALLGASLVSWCFLPILHCRWGVDNPGWLGIGSLLGMVLYAEAYHSYLMFQYIKVWLVLMVVQRIVRDKLQHSMYMGYPWLAALLPPAGFITDPTRREVVARWFEPLLCVLAGTIVSRWDLRFGQFIFAGAYSLLIVQVIHRMLDARIRVEMNNAMVEAEKYR